jgi:outer membrane protein assembly factor BamB
MTRCLDGGTLNAAKRLFLQRAIIFLVLASFVLAACGRSPDANWPGMTVDDQGVVYVAFGQVIAVNVETNEQLWSFPQEGVKTGPIYAAPTVVDGTVYFGDFGTSSFTSPSKAVNIYSLSASSGTLNSGWPASDIAHDRILAPALVADGKVFIGTADNKVFALDMDTAQPLWPTPFEAGHSIWGKPAYVDGVLYVPSLDKNVYALDASDGSLIWQSSVDGSISDKVVTDTDLIYVGSFDKHVYALNRENGEVVWAASAEAAVWGAPLHVNGIVYFADQKGNVFAVDDATGGEIWRSSGAGYVIAQPVTVADKIIIASAGDPAIPRSQRVGGELIAYDAKSGSELWRKGTSQPLFSTPVVAGDKIVVAQQDAQALLVYFNADGAQTGTYALPTTQGQ